jgi:hypothetical protein
MAILGIKGVIGMDVRNSISFRDGHGEETEGARGVRMNYVQTGDYFERSMVIRYPRPHSWVKREFERREAVDSRLIFTPIGIVWCKDMHLMSFARQFPLHDLDHCNDTAGVGDVSICEKTDFH